MLDFLADFLSGFFGMLAGLLPDSPFADWASVAEGFSTGLGWLNWLVDVGGCLAIFVAWIALALVVTVAKVVFSRAVSQFDKLSVWNGD